MKTVRIPVQQKMKDALNEKDLEAATRYLYRTWQNALQWIASRDDNETIQQAREIYQWALSIPWHGRTGSTDKATYLAHLQIIMGYGNRIYRASARRLAEMSGVTWQTSRNANHRLQEQGLIELYSPYTGRMANLWGMVIPDERLEKVRDFSHSLSCTQTPSWEDMTIKEKNLEHDAFRWGALNKSGIEIYDVLLGQGAVTPKEIAELTGRGVSTIYRKLDAMCELGMVEKLSARTWVLTDDVDLSKVAVELGTAGKGAAQRVQHEMDRRRHNLVLEMLKKRSRLVDERTGEVIG